MKSETLYQRVKLALSRMAPTTPASIARELDADPEATRLALEDMKRRGKAIDRPSESGNIMWFAVKKRPVRRGADTPRPIDINHATGHVDCDCMSCRPWTT